MQSKGRAIIAGGLLLVSGFILAQGPGPNRNLGTNIPVQPGQDNSSSGPPRAGDITIDVNLVNMDVVVVDKSGNPIGGLEKRQIKIFYDRRSRRGVHAVCDVLQQHLQFDWRIRTFIARE
jgi:hypothetical protein